MSDAKPRHTIRMSGPIHFVKLGIYFLLFFRSRTDATIRQIQNKDNNPNTQIPVCQPLPIDAFIIQ